MSLPTTEQILAGAQAMHAAFEQRAQHRNPFYSRVPWERLSEDNQAEFINYVIPALTAALATHNDHDRRTSADHPHSSTL